jgi:hypothetical protein
MVVLQPEILAVGLSMSGVTAPDLRVDAVSPGLATEPGKTLNSQIHKRVVCAIAAAAMQTVAPSFAVPIASMIPLRLINMERPVSNESRQKSIAQKQPAYSTAFW